MLRTFLLLNTNSLWICESIQQQEYVLLLSRQIFLKPVYLFSNRVESKRFSRIKCFIPEVPGVNYNDKIKETLKLKLDISDEVLKKHFNRIIK